jgi:hypothetical protein
MVPSTLDEFAKFVSDQVIAFATKPTSNTNEPQFPFYYRPSKKIRTILKSTPDSSSIGLTAYSNMQQLLTKIRITTTDLSPGYGLALDAKFSPEIPFIPKKEKRVKITSEQIENSAAILGANNLFLLSNETTIPGKSKIKFKSEQDNKIPSSVLSNPAVKFEQESIAQDVIPNTSSMVRGEELLELLESIVGFLVSHVHPYPLLPPSSVAYDGTSTDDLLKKMLEAYQKVLNSNIRIN